MKIQAHADNSQDFYFGNVGVATEELVSQHKELSAGKAYIIDYDRSRRFELGPGQQHAVELPSPALKPPLGMKQFDPYSWDMYCVGQTFDWLLKVRLLTSLQAPSNSIISWH